MAEAGAPEFERAPKKRPLYTLRPTITSPSGQERAGESRGGAGKEVDPFLRPEAEDDDGYDPFSDRPPTPE
ncbi:MAG TPA: hypothetical protein H9877_01615, partial [Candidatus Gordonibacter avicola]|nr:hypothetical protein [Candidatus Gordonibacter avicola]